MAASLRAWEASAMAAATLAFGNNPPAEPGAFVHGPPKAAGGLLCSPALRANTIDCPPHHTPHRCTQVDLVMAPLPHVSPRPHNPSVQNGESSALMPPLALRNTHFSASTEAILPKMSNFYCLPGRAGGPPLVASVRQVLGPWAGEPVLTRHSWV
jgi:hypothetical protein